MDIFTRVEVLPGLNLSGQSDTVTKASNLIEENTKGVKYKTNNSIKVPLKNFLLNKWSFQLKY